MILNYLFGILFGLAGGSFLGVVVERSSSSARLTINARLPTRQDLRLTFFGRSRCSSCHHQLSWWENIPLISYIILRGKCRQCRSPIPYWLPLIEIAGAAAGLVLAGNITVINFITVINVISAIFIAAALIWIFFSDLVYGLIPDWAVAVGSLGAILQKVPYLTVRYGTLQLSLLSAFGAAAFFWLLVKITRGRGMGAGDITLAFFLGLWLGWPLIVVGLWLAFVIGAIFGIVLIILKKKKLKSAIPFGPFMIIGSLVVLLCGDQLLARFF